MDAQVLLDNLTQRLEDPAEETFTELMKLRFLNEAQTILMGLAPKDFLANLETNASVAFVANKAPLPAAIVGRADRVVRVMNPVGLEYKIYPIKDRRLYVNTFKTPTATRPGGILYATEFESLIGTAESGSAVIHYIATPVDITNSVTSELHDSLHVTLLDIAESLAFDADDQSDRANTARQRYMMFLQSIGGQVQQVDSVEKGFAGE